MKTISNLEKETNKILDNLANKNGIPKIRILNIKELISIEFPPTVQMMGGWLTRSSLNMIHASRGVGKTNFALGISCALAGGVDFIGWKIPKAFKVTYIDGELPGNILKERVQNLSKFYPSIEENFNLIPYDLQEAGMLDLSFTLHQELLFPYIKDCDVLIIDSIATLLRSSSDPNDSRSWISVQSWLLSLRKHGIAVIILHHDGKNGSQRGTSAKEDILDNVIQLKNADGYSSSDGCKFELHFKKSRSCFGEDVESKLIELTDKGFSAQSLVDPMISKILSMKNQGLNQRDISQNLDISLGKVNGIIKRYKIECSDVHF